MHLFRLINRRNVSPVIGALALAIVMSSRVQAACPFNVSGVAQSALTSDGLLFIRYAQRGSSGVANGSFAANTGSVSGASAVTAIQQNINALDLDGNGRYDADDAILIARYLAGYRSDALRAVASDATRVQGYEIETFIANRCGRTVCDETVGRVLEVGPGKPYAVPSDAAAIAQDGDIIKIASGDYAGDYATWSANNLTLCGAGGRARLFKTADISNGKAIWVIRGNDVTVDAIEFHNAAVIDQNGAGIRTEGVNLTVINSGFYDNENGILGGLSTESTVTIQRSEFARNGFGDGYSHNLYIGNIGRLVVANSYFHEAKIGHNLKSRARVNVIENSYLMDGPTGTSSYVADFPNGGEVTLRGNAFHKGPSAENGTAAISYGQEGLTNPVNRLLMNHNTIVMQAPGGNYAGYLTVATGTQSVELNANLLASTGSPTLVVGGFNAASVVQRNNLFTAASNVPGADNILAPNFWPSATIQSQLPLSAPLDANYVIDAPKLFQSRALVSATRLIGAIQSSP